MAQIAADKTNGSEPREGQEETQCQKCGGHGVMEVIMPDCLGAEAATVERPCPKCSGTGKVSHFVDANNMVSAEDKVNDVLENAEGDILDHLDDTSIDAGDVAFICDTLKSAGVAITAILRRERERADEAEHATCVMVERLAERSSEIARLKADLEWERKVWPDEISAAIGLNADSVGRTPSMCAAAVKSEIDRLKHAIGPAYVETSPKDGRDLIMSDDVKNHVFELRSEIDRLTKLHADQLGDFARRSEKDSMTLKARIAELEAPRVMKRYSDECRPENEGWYWYFSTEYRDVFEPFPAYYDNRYDRWANDDEQREVLLPATHWLELEAPPVVPEGCAS